MNQVGAVLNHVGIVTHQCHSSRIVKDAVLDSEAAVVNDANHAHTRHHIETVEAEIINSIEHLVKSAKDQESALVMKLTAMPVYITKVKRMSRKASFLSSKGERSLLTYVMARLMIIGWL